MNSPRSGPTQATKGMRLLYCTSKTFYAAVARLACIVGSAFSEMVVSPPISANRCLTG